MKRAKGLYDQIWIYENLLSAFRKAAKGKQARPEVMAFRARLDDQLAQLARDLKNHDLDIGHYRFFKVWDPKPREICAASFPERVLHHAVMNLCEPVLESYAIYDSYACRKGKGNEKALERAQYFSNRFSWYLKLDVKKYFDSIDHAVMMDALKRRFKDRELLDLFEKIIDSYHKLPGKGLPIGNLISQHLANFYLGRFDHWVKEVLLTKGYVRYMDDMVFWSKEKSELNALGKRVEGFLEAELSLTVKANRQLNRCRYGIPFLGYRVYPWGRRLSVAGLKRFKEKFRAYERRYIKGEWSMEELCRHVEALIAVTRKSSAKGFRQKIITDFGMVS